MPTRRRASFQSCHASLCRGASKQGSGFDVPDLNLAEHRRPLYCTLVKGQYREAGERLHFGLCAPKPAAGIFPQAFGLVESLGVSRQVHPRPRGARRLQDDVALERVERRLDVVIAIRSIVPLELAGHGLTPVARTQSLTRESEVVHRNLDRYRLLMELRRPRPEIPRAWRVLCGEPISGTRTPHE
jgi:hypothetical protein